MTAFSVSGVPQDVLPVGPLSARPAAGVMGRLYFVTDATAQRWTRDNGTSWDDIALHWSQVMGLSAAMDAREVTANKGQANGYASLNAQGLIPIAQIPALDSVMMTHNEVPTGLKNGINTVYLTAHTFITGTSRVYLNGLRLALADDYAESLGTTLTMASAPVSTDHLIVDYSNS